ncbi:MAG: DsbA family protein [Proteobacteria bacterium]|nr:DsbA family protein [Pseudomonadota bacterium]
MEYFGGPSSDRQAVQPAASPAAPAAVAAVEIGTDEFIIGDANAPVTIVEYASLTCPHCANFHVNILPELKKSYIDTGKARLVYRDFPLDRLALSGSMMARCAGRERYFGFIDTMYRMQESWRASKDQLKALARIGLLGGMSQEDFDACMKDKAMEDRVMAMRLDGQNEFAIDSTPSFIINGKKYSGVVDFARFEKILEPLLKQQ